MSEETNLYLLVIQALGHYKVWAIFDNRTDAVLGYESCRRTCPSGVSECGVYVYVMKANGPTPNFKEVNPLFGKLNIASSEKKVIWKDNESRGQKRISQDELYFYPKKIRKQT